MSVSHTSARRHSRLVSPLPSAVLGTTPSALDADIARCSVRWLPGRAAPTRETSLAFHMLVGRLAERKGFEPLRRFPAYTLSRRAPSTTRPPLRWRRESISAPPVQATLSGRDPDGSA